MRFPLPYIECCQVFNFKRVFPRKFQIKIYILWYENILISFVCDCERERERAGKWRQENIYSKNNKRDMRIKIHAYILLTETRKLLELPVAAVPREKYRKKEIKQKYKYNTYTQCGPN